MTATVRRHGTGSAWSCDECPDKFRFSGVCTSVAAEGRTIMQRQADAHNAKYHAAASS